MNYILFLEKEEKKKKGKEEKKKKEKERKKNLVTRVFKQVRELNLRERFVFLKKVESSLITFGRIEDKSIFKGDLAMNVSVLVVIKRVISLHNFSWRMGKHFGNSADKASPERAIT